MKPDCARLSARIAATCAVIGLSAVSAPAAALWSFVEVGDDVVGALSGSLLTIDATVIGAQAFPFTGILSGPAGIVQTSPPGEPPATLKVLAASGPSTFGGTGGVASLTDIYSGSAFGVVGPIGDAGAAIAVEEDYAAGPLSGTMTFLGASFATLGVTPGSYVWELPYDTVTVRFGPEAPDGEVPLPASLPLLAGALGLVALRRRR